MKTEGISSYLVMPSIAIYENPTSCFYTVNLLAQQ